MVLLRLDNFNLISTDSCIDFFYLSLSLHDVVILSACGNL